MRFKGQFSQPVGQGGLHMPGTRHVAPPRLNNSFCANRPAVAPRAFAPKSKTNEMRPLPPCPQTEIRFRSHKFGHCARHSTQIPQTRCCNPEQRTAGPLPMSDLGRRPYNQEVQDRAHCDMLQGRCQPNPPPSNNMGRMLAMHGRHAVNDGLQRQCLCETGSRTGQLLGTRKRGWLSVTFRRTRTIPHETHAGAPRGWTSARSSVPDARSMCALA